MSFLLESVLDSVRRSQCEAHDAADREADMAHRNRRGMSLRHLASEPPSMYRQPEPAHYSIDLHLPGQPDQHFEGTFCSDLDARLAAIGKAPPGATFLVARDGELVEAVGMRRAS